MVSLSIARRMRRASAPPMTRRRINRKFQSWAYRNKPVGWACTVQSPAFSRFLGIGRKSLVAIPADGAAVCRFGVGDWLIGDRVSSPAARAASRRFGWINLFRWRATPHATSEVRASVAFARGRWSLRRLLRLVPRTAKRGAAAFARLLPLARTRFLTPFTSSSAAIELPIELDKSLPIPWRSFLAIVHAV